MKISPIEVKLIDHMGSDLSVVNAARVSFEKESDWDRFNCKSDFDLHDKMLEEGWEDTTDPDGWDATCRKLSQGDVKLVNYLAKHKHFSPFNHAFMSFRVKAPIFVARQLVKHKFLPWNEVSRRYVDSEPEFYIPEQLRKKADNVKQGSSDESVNGHYTDQVVIHSDVCLKMYNMLLKTGVCPEQARMVLPANMMTEWIWSGSLGAFADMLHLRLDPHSQKESRDVAELIYAQALPLFPVSLKALLESK